MRRLLPSVWLLGAAAYTALTLFLTRPEEWPLPPRLNETVIAKQLPKAARLIFPNEIPVAQAAAAPAAQPQIERRNEWVRVADYTTVGRLHPSAASPVMFAYPVNRPLRVIAREAGFVRVQDLSSGRLGWIAESALTPFFGGYRIREDTVPQPLVAAAEPVVPKPQEIAAGTPVAEKRVAPARTAAIAQPRKETVAAAEPEPRGLFRRKRNQVQHVAFGKEESGVAGIMQRAFNRF